MFRKNLTAHNRWICGFAFGYAQICSAYAPQTSHIPKMLSAIGCLESGKRYHWQNILRRDDKND